MRLQTHIARRPLTSTDTHPPGYHFDANWHSKLELNVLQLHRARKHVTMEVIASICLGVRFMANVSPIGTILLVHKWPTYYNIYVSAHVGISINNWIVVITLHTRCLLNCMSTCVFKCQLFVYFYTTGARFNDKS